MLEIEEIAKIATGWNKQNIKKRRKSLIITFCNGDFTSHSLQSRNRFSKLWLSDSALLFLSSIPRVRFRFRSRQSAFCLSMRTGVAAILFTLAAVLICIEVCAGATYSFRLIHRFSDEARSVWAAKGRQGPWPERDSVERARLLLSSDFKHQRLRLGSQKQLLVPSEGSQTFDYGNDWSWLVLKRNFSRFHFQKSGAEN